MGLAGLVRMVFGSGRRIAAAMTALAVFATGAMAAAQGLTDGPERADLVRVRFGGDAQQTRVVIELTRSATARLLDQNGEPRLIVALPGVDAGEGQTGRGVGLVHSYELDQAAGAARLRLALTRPAEVSRRFLLPPGDGVEVYRYVIDLAAPGAPSGRAQERDDPPPVESRREAPPERRVIVIDAGHGGTDPGALGSRVQEREVTLAAALELRRQLEATGRYRVVLTRSTDVLVPHARRVQIAREAGADLFISLHADAGANPQTRGASVYTLSDRGAERAAREALGGGSYGGIELPAGDPSVRRVLLDLTQRATLNRSSVFAGELLDAIGGEAPLLERSHRDDNFAVLLAPDVPAVLLEMGFITNPEDERLLGDSAGRSRLMGAVTRAIDAYFAPDLPGARAAAP
ncbi:N-acetylmuramoyl-L-alanine amidase [Brevundimonas sp.]|uniref:N-acetylmuramoyl-L-alanine amidase family protein n=1 Tax=Brevundimonas sp. TaxID=1871086 RepID=UPI0025CD0E41|nr:N-acetylmuramoyl-L-alanine amidase [Brevundimonas sp.]